MSELTAGQALDSQFFSSSRRRKGSQRTTFQRTSSESPTPPVSRRNLLKILGGVAIVAATGIGVKAELDNQHFLQEEAPYQGWEKYRNSALPQSLIMQIGQNIQNSDYPGFSEVGKLIQKTQTEYGSFHQLYPGFTKPVEIRLDDLVRQEGALADFNTQLPGIGVDVMLKDKKTGTTQKLVMVDPIGVSFCQIRLDNSLHLGSSMAKKMLLIKEFSHLLYMDQFKDMLSKEITGRFDITTSAKAPLADLLVMTAYDFGDPTKPSPLGYIFDNAGKLIDFAGYWHIMQAMGVAMEKGVLTKEDLAAMYSDKNSFDLALKKGLLTELSRGNFVWKEGIGPFSQEWADVMKVTF